MVYYCDMTVHDAARVEMYTVLLSLSHSFTFSQNYMLSASRENWISPHLPYKCGYNHVPGMKSETDRLKRESDVAVHTWFKTMSEKTRPS